MTGQVLVVELCDVEISTNHRFTFAFARKILFLVLRPSLLRLHTACRIRVRPIKSIWNTLLQCTENEHMPLCHRNLSSRSLLNIQLIAS